MSKFRSRRKSEKKKDGFPVIKGLGDLWIFFYTIILCNIFEYKAATIKRPR